jgi:hypothetical protein
MIETKLETNFDQALGKVTGSVLVFVSGAVPSAN